MLLLLIFVVNTERFCLIFQSQTKTSRLNPVMSPNSQILVGLEFLFYGPVKPSVRLNKIGHRE